MMIDQVWWGRAPGRKTNSKWEGATGCNIQTHEEEKTDPDNPSHILVRNRAGLLWSWFYCCKWAGRSFRMCFQWLLFQGFVTCAYGVHIVGRVLIVFGICDALASIGFGFIIKKIGRIPIFILGALINILVIIVMFSWAPTASAVGGISPDPFTAVTN